MPAHIRGGNFPSVTPTNNMSVYHSFKAGTQSFEIYTIYKPIRPIGQGAYGVVISAQKEEGEKVAIKKVSRAFEDIVDAKRILREIKLMKKFNHENIVQVFDIIPPPPTAEEFDDIYIVQHLMETDLHRIIYSGQTLSIDHTRYFIYQTLRGLKYIHSSNVIHRDLKPSNLLVDSNCEIKICDFGLARPIDEDEGSPTPGGSPLTEYVVTRWYRAPEIMLACQEYTKAIDLWSVGCIFAELLSRDPIFPGNDYINQLTLICGKLGKPKESDMDFVTSERARRFIFGLPNTPPIPMRELFPAYRREDAALDLLARLLEFHPDRRITAEQALNHPFLSSHHQETDEPVADFHFTFEFENEELSRDRVRELIWEEIRDYHPDIAPINPTAVKKSRRLSGTPNLRRNSRNEGALAGAKEGGGGLEDKADHKIHHSSELDSKSSSDRK